MVRAYVQGPLLVKWINFYPILDKQLYTIWVGGITCLFPKFNDCALDVRKDKLFYITFYWAGDYLSMLGLKLLYVSILGPILLPLMYGCSQVRSLWVPYLEYV